MALRSGSGRDGSGHDGSGHQGSGRDEAAPDRTAGWQWLVLAAMGLVAVAHRLVMTLAVDGPATVDGGNWLAFGHDMVGDDVRSSAIVYPPVVPILVLVVTEVLGVATGMAVLVAVASVIPALGCALVLQRVGIGWLAVPLSGLVLFSGAAGESAAWGGFPQLIALGLVPVVLWRLDHHLRNGGVRNGLVVGASVLGVAATSHFVLAVVAVAGAAMTVVHVVVRPAPDAPPVWRRLRDLVPGALLSAPLVPLYLSLHQVGESVADPGVRRGLGDLPRSIDYVVRDLRPLWWATAVVVVAVPFVLYDRRRTPLWAVSTSLTVAVLVLLVVLRDARVAYALPTAGALALGAVIADATGPTGSLSRRGRRLIGAVLAMLVTAQAVAGARLFDDQVGYYAVAADGVSEGLEWVSTETGANQLVAVSPVRSAPAGWWSEGLARRRTLVASSLRWLYFPDEQDRATVANDVFGPDFPTPRQVQRARGAGVDVVLVAKEWSGYSEPAIREAVAAGRVSVEYENDGVVVLGL